MSAFLVRKSFVSVTIGAAILAAGVGFSPAASAAPTGGSNEAQVWSTQEIDGCYAIQDLRGVIVYQEDSSGARAIGAYMRNSRCY